MAGPVPLERLARRVKNSARFHITRRAQLRQRPGLVDSYLREQTVRKLQVGAGSNLLAGWLNGDLEPSAPGVVFLDATQPLPFPAATFDFLFTEHMVEHIPYASGQAFLAEAFRVLRPGGVLRVATPDLARLVAAYTADELDAAQQRYVDWVSDTFLPGLPRRPVFVLNLVMRAWGHTFLYDEPTLREALEAAGFTGVTTAEPGESEHEELRGVDSHGEFIDADDICEFETMVFEATKPRA